MNIIKEIKNLFNKLFNNKKKMLPENTSNIDNNKNISQNKTIENKEIVNEKYQDKINKIKELKEQNEKLDKVIEEKSKVLYATLNDIEKLTKDAV